MSDDVTPCEMPPVGWTCSRGAGHDGPCAASPDPGSTKYERAVLKALFDRAIQQRDEALAERDALLTEVERLKAENELTQAAFYKMNADLGDSDSELFDARAEVERLKSNQQPDDGEWTWQYGFYLDGDFVHHGDEGQTRRLARFAKKPIMRRQVRYGRVEPAQAESESKPSDTPPESTTDQTTPNGV